MQMPQHVLKLTAHLRDFIADIERGRRPDWNTVERASFKFCTLKLYLHGLPKHETVLAAAEHPDYVPGFDAPHNPRIPPPTEWDWNDPPDYPAHEPGRSQQLDPGNE